MRAPEILAPAGDLASLNAALQAGADAVYFGLDEGLNARARARNFPVAELGDTCDRIHRAGARAYLTLNTLVFEEELPLLERLLRQAAAAGIDALIVQDPAVALLARAIAPSLELHASTQMTISSPEAALFAEKLGISRVVVPRELSVKEIKSFADNCPLELEVFVHGALCMSWSGQCLTSEAWGGRSANRGACAQSCRLPYQLVLDGELRELGEVEYLLSPLDLAAVRAVPQLVEIGVHGLKIEGRLKGPAYVRSTVEGYKRWVDAALKRRSEAATPQLKKDLGKMAIAYSRGFSDGFLGGSDHQELVEGRFPKHRGVLVGEVVELGAGRVRVRRSSRAGSGGAARAEEALSEATAASTLLPAWGGEAGSAGLAVELPELKAGMGVGFDDGRPEEKEEGGPLFGVEPAPGGWWLSFGRPGPDLRKVRVGQRVWLSSDASGAVAEEEPEGRIPVRLRLWGTEGQPLQARMIALGPVGREVAVEAATAQVLTAAAGRGLEEAILREKVGALGGSPFRLEELEVELREIPLHLPVSALKGLRRELVAALLPGVLAKARHPLWEGDAAARVVAEAGAMSAGLVGIRRGGPAAGLQIVPLCRNEAQLEAVLAAGLPEVELDWMELVGLRQAVERAKAAGLRVGIATVRVQKPGEDGYDRRIAALEPDSVLVRHWGGLVHFAGLPADQRPVVHGDFSLNVTNSVTAHRLLAMGADTLTAAHDLDEKQLHALLRRVPAERIAVALHHHISTFHTEHCVYAHLLSKGRDWRSCGRPCEKHQLSLRDVNGLEHPVIVDVGCRNTVFNAQAQTAAGAVSRLLAAGVRRYRIEFVRETREQAASVLAAYEALFAGKIGVPELRERIAVQEQFGVTAGTMRTMGEGR